MPRAIAKGNFDQYNNVRAGAVRAIGETNDCTVVALAAATGCGYDKAHELLQRRGRKPRRGFSMHQVADAAKELGFSVTRVAASEFVSKYPEPHRSVLKGVTSHHPDRFNKVWRDGHNYWLCNSRHVLAVVNGTTIDWSRGRALRCDQIWRIEKSEQPVVKMYIPF